MNDQQIELPELTASAVDRIERDVFAEIAAGPPRRVDDVARGRARRRRWLTGVGVAAAFAVGVMVTPLVTGLGTPSAMDGASSVPEGADIVGMTMDGAGSVAAEDAAMSADTAAGAEREIIARGSVTVEVDDIAGAVRAVTDLAEAHDGFVESTSVSEPTSLDADQRERVAGYGWISIRVPSGDLSTVIEELDAVGTVGDSEISQQDVTMATIDLRARVDALEASVARLTELMSESGSLSDLIAAEVALTDRQAELESYRQQLTALEDQVAMSSLDVQLVRTPTTVPADPAGFGDGLLAGWNGLVVSLNALVIAVGFILPWLAIAGIVVLVVWLVRRRRRADAPAE